MGYMDELGILAFMPFTKCTVKENEDSLSTNDDIWIYKKNHLKLEGFDYECVENFDESQSDPPS